MLNLISLREQVYTFLKEQMHSGALLPGSTLNLNKLSDHLGISKTPLRDALIQLETEGFVEILPRRGVRVTSLSKKDVKNLYEIIGCLESGIITAFFDRFTKKEIKRLTLLNDKSRKAVKDKDFDAYYELNLQFHNVYLEFSDNDEMIKLLTQLKQRLYDFPRRSYIQEWEMNNLEEHAQFIELVKKGDAVGAAEIMRAVHWSYQVQEKSIRKFYSLVVEHIEAERALREK